MDSWGKEPEVTYLTTRQWVQFQEALERPAQVLPELRALLERVGPWVD